MGRGSLARARTVAAAAAVAAMAGSLLIAAPASAGRPDREPFSFSDTRHFPAGTLCDFDSSVEFTITGTDLAFFDDGGEFSHLIEISSAQVAHVNEETGYTLTESLRSVLFYDAASDTSVVVGVNWKLRDASGKIVLVRAGRLVTDEANGEIVSVTPNFGPDSAAVICPALGGSPA